MPLVITYTSFHTVMGHCQVNHNEGGSGCPWYVVHDDVFIADIGGQAFNIFPHSPESAQMMVIVKSYPFTHSHDKNNLTAKPQIPQTWCIQPVVLFLSCCFPKEVFTGYFAYTSIFKMCALGILLHIYPEVVYTRNFLTHLSASKYMFTL